MKNSIGKPYERVVHVRFDVGALIVLYNYYLSESKY